MHHFPSLLGELDTLKLASGGQIMSRTPMLIYPAATQNVPGSMYILES